MLCMHLLQNCLVFVNTLMVQELLEDPVRRARLDEADWRALTPLMYHHVNPYGVYTLDFGSRIPFASQERAA